jgi:carbon starvation protein
VTLAVGMSQIFTEAMRRISDAASSLRGGKAAVDLQSVIKYWYHFAIMFEALFILTTIDTGTRIARFLLQEVLGKIYRPFDRTDWLPGAVLSTALVTAAWGGLIWTGSIDTIWPMFGIANQMLAAVALCVVSSVMINAGKGRYAALTILPMCFVITTTLTAGYQMIAYTFWPLFWREGLEKHDVGLVLRGVLNTGFTLFMIASVLVILIQAITRWLNVARRGSRP